MAAAAAARLGSSWIFSAGGRPVRILSPMSFIEIRTRYKLKKKIILLSLLLKILVFRPKIRFTRPIKGRFRRISRGGSKSIYIPLNTVPKSFVFENVHLTCRRSSCCSSVQTVTKPVDLQLSTIVSHATITVIVHDDKNNDYNSNRRLSASFFSTFFTFYVFAASFQTIEQWRFWAARDCSLLFFARTERIDSAFPGNLTNNDDSRHFSV